MIPQTLWAFVIAYATLTQAAVLSGGRRDGPMGAPVPTPVPRNNPVPRAVNAAAYSSSYSSSTSAAAASASAYYLSEAQSAEAGRNYGWSAVGCYRDSPNRMLSAMSLSWDNMTLPICMNACFGNGYTYGGVQYGRECWCGSKINSGTYTGSGDNYIKTGDPYGTIVDYSECQAFPCAGDKTTYCGNNWRNNVFTVSDNSAAKSAIAASASASAASASASTYSSSASVYSASSASVYSASASTYSSSSLAASASAYSSATSYSASASAYSSRSLAASVSTYSSQASAYSSSSLAASASAYSSVSAYNSSVAAYSQSTLAASASAWSSASTYSSSSLAASMSAYSSQASAYSSSSNAASASAYSSATKYSASASAYSSSSLAASASAWSSASTYSSSSLAASASAYSSASNYNASVAAYSQSTAAASASTYSSNAAAFSASTAAAAASSAAQFSATSLAAYSSASTSLAAYSASSSSSAAAALATGIPSGWSKTNGACVAEGSTGRALTGASTAAQDMTYNKCIAFCQKGGFALAGIEYSSECFCGNVLANGASLDKQSQQCTMGCSGAPSVICGGPNAITLFIADGAAAKLSADLTQKPISLPTGWAVASTACIAEGTTGRALTGSSTASDDMTVPKCASYCSGLNFQYAGVEFGRECYCGNDILNGASLNTPSTTCNMPCAGNPSVNCGGSNGLQLYANSAVGQSNTASASSVAAASASAYSASVSASNAAYSASASASNAAYSASASAAAAASSSASAAAASANAAALAKLPSGWKPATTTCILEVSGRALTGASTSTNDMTIQKCASFCSSKGYTLAGLEYGSECYCGNNLDNGASLDKVSTTCNMQCSGDSTFTCGGPNGVQLYTGPTTTTSTSAAPATSTSAGPNLATNLPTGWSASSTNCLMEVNGRALTGASTATNDMTIAKCIAYCSNLGFKLAGVEYASECFCGNSLSNGASLDVSSQQCNMACSGDSTTLCGGPNAIQLYTNPNAVAPSTSASASASASSSAKTAGPTAATNLPTTWKAADTPCVMEVTGRALTGFQTTTADMTINKCLTMCEQKGFTYAGVEYGGECFCGQGLSNGASLSVPSGSCSMGCNGDATTLCGGPDAIQLYIKPKVSTINGYTSTGCIQEVVGRALNATSTQADDMTLEKCTSFCSTNGYKMAGIEYGSECYCGNSLVGGATTTASSLSYECKMPCPGNSAETCGGPDAINLYVKN